MRKIKAFEPWGYLYFSECFIYIEFGDLSTEKHTRISGSELWKTGACFIIRLWESLRDFAFAGL